MQPNPKNTPVLRFPGFDEPWVDISLGEIGSFKNGLNKAAEEFGFGYPFVNLMDVFGKPALSTQELGLVNSSPKEREIYNLQQGDVLFIRSSVKREGVGETSVVLNDLRDTVYSGFLIRFREETPLLDLNFKRYCFHTRRFRNNLISVSTSSANTNINQESLSDLFLTVPSLQEQQKIAAFLSTVDEKIEQLARKKELLLNYKKGIMQKIFDRSLRFKDDHGNDFPDWKEKRFADLFSFLPTNSFSRDALNYNEGTVKNIHYGDIHTSFRPLFEVNNERVPFINKEVSLNGVADKSFCKEGDLVFADASEDYSDVGKCIEIMNLNGELLLAGLHTLLARPEDNAFAPGFASFLMRSWKSRWQIMREAQGTKVLGISAGRLSKIRLSLPSIEEQEKIAALLTALSKKIELTEKQEESTIAFKKSLLQQMFV